MKPYCTLIVVLLATGSLCAQQITGVWKGKIDRRKVEVKIVQNGDSLTGTSYYYESAANYRRYSIKGYFDPNTNEAIWWDDQLVEEGLGKGISLRGETLYQSTADFNCPGGGKMLLEGNAARKDRPDRSRGPVALEKTGGTAFRDEWDFVIDNFTVGTNDPNLIDSIGQLAARREPAPQPVRTPAPERTRPAAAPAKETASVADMRYVAPPAPEVKAAPVIPLTIEQKFTTRERVIALEIPLAGDSVELRFYDNAEIDGDSISLFFNEQLIYSHIRLTGSAWTLKLPVAEMKDSNDLTMVAENLGAIPPNTSYMVAIVDNRRYEAVLASTEGSSATVRFVRKQE